MLLFSPDPSHEDQDGDAYGDERENGQWRIDFGSPQLEEEKIALSEKDC